MTTIINTTVVMSEMISSAIAAASWIVGFDPISYNVALGHTWIKLTGEDTPVFISTEMVEKHRARRQARKMNVDLLAEKAERKSTDKVLRSKRFRTIRVWDPRIQRWTAIYR